MTPPPERSPERDAAIAAALVHVPDGGWTRAALRAAMRDLGRPAEDAALLFPAGAADLIEAYINWVDRRMENEAASLDLAGRKPPERIRALIVLRLTLSRPHKETVRRAVAVMALPRHARMAARALARTTDAIWHAADDRSADFSWYTKRAILAGVYTAIVLFWLADDSDDEATTLAFLDRRLADVARIGKLRRRTSEGVKRLLPPSLRKPDRQAT